MEVLTVRHIGDDRKERIFSVVSVNYDPDVNEIVAFQTLNSHDDSGNAIRFSTGTLYVMNQGGQTVAIYNLKFKKKQ